MIASGITPAGQRVILGVSVALIEAEVARAIRSVFNCPNRLAAEHWLKEIVGHCAKSAPKPPGSPEENLPQGLMVFTLPAAHQKRMRTTNALERVHQELKRRTRVARVFPNEKSILRLITARYAKPAAIGKLEKSTSTRKTETQPQFNTL